jgi:glycosyltransferase involved in cell wall biosynthesis
MRRLLIVCEYPTLLGGERSMLSTLPAVAAAGFEILIAGPTAGPLAAAVHERGISHIEWPTRGENGERLPLERLRSELAKIIRGARPDLIHANSLSTARIAGPVAAQCSTQSLGHLRDILRLPRQAIEDLNRHGRLVAVSRATRDFHVMQGVDAKRCSVIYNGVDLEEFRPRPPSGYLHRELGLPPTARLMATIGQLGLRKGTDVVLSAALQVAPDVPTAHWLIVGERTSNKDESREFEELLCSLAKEPPLAGRVHFLGSRGDVPRLLNECELLIHAARQEPLGRVLLESAASGLAAIATEVGGTREIFPAENAGALLVPADNRLAMADALLAALRDNGRRQALGAAARRRAEEAFDVRLAAARLVELYENVLT